MNIAVLAHPPEESERLAGLLGAGGFPAQAFDQLPALLAHLAEHPCDLLVTALDGVSPEALPRLRAACPPGTPLLLIADLPRDEDLVCTTVSSCDDYLAKPLRRQELVARARVLLRRAHPQHPAWAGIAFDGFVFDPSRPKVTSGATTTDLTRKEYDLALLLFRHLGRPLSRAYMLEMLWPDEAERSSRTLDTHISRVRNKLGLRPDNGYRLSPVYSYGYLLEHVQSSHRSDVHE